MPSETNRTIVFITGAFLSHDCWHDWERFFEHRGYDTLTLPWPGKDASSETLRRRHPDPQVADIRLADLISYYESVCESLPLKPIVIGHSMGGLIAQVMASTGKAHRAVALHSVPPKGIFTFQWSFYKAGWGPLGFFTDADKTFMMSLSQWRYAFTNGMEPDVQELSYFDYAIPESKKVVRDTITNAAFVDFRAAHAPLLFIAGESDHAIPPSLNRANCRRYTDAASVRDFRQFPGRNHFVLKQDGWQEIALFIREWLRVQDLAQASSPEMPDSVH